MPCVRGSRYGRQQALEFRVVRAGRKRFGEFFRFARPSKKAAETSIHWLVILIPTRTLGIPGVQQRL